MSHLPRLCMVCGGGTTSAGLPPRDLLENLGKVEVNHFSLAEATIK